MATRKSIAQTAIDGSRISFIFEGGHKVNLDLNKLHEDIQSQLAVHGAVQKIRDSFAGAQGDVNFAVAQAEAVVEAFQSGQFNRRGGGAGSSLLAEAVARVKKITLEEAKEKLDKLDDEQIAQLKAAPTVKAEIAAIQAERKRKAAQGGDDSALDLV